MVLVKRLEPDHINVNEAFIFVILKHKGFTLMIDNKLYEMVPNQTGVIRINRKTRRIENTDAKIMFQQGDTKVDIGIKELLYVPEFLVKLHDLIQVYFDGQIEFDQPFDNPNDDIDLIIDELEAQNIRRLIDKALDHRDEAAFYSLLKKL